MTTTIAHDLRCTEQTVRHALHAFHQRGLATLQLPSSRPHTIATIFDVGPCEGSGAQLLFRAWGSLSLLAFLLHDFWILPQKSNCATEPMTYPTASTLSQHHRKGNVPTLGTDDQGITTHDSPLSTTPCPGESAQRE